MPQQNLQQQQQHQHQQQLHHVAGSPIRIADETAGLPARSVLLTHERQRENLELSRGLDRYKMNARLLDMSLIAEEVELQQKKHLATPPSSAGGRLGGGGGVGGFVRDSENHNDNDNNDGNLPLRTPRKEEHNLLKRAAAVAGGIFSPFNNIPRSARASPVITPQLPSPPPQHSLDDSSLSQPSNHFEYNQHLLLSQKSPLTDGTIGSRRAGRERAKSGGNANMLFGSPASEGGGGGQFEMSPISKMPEVPAAARNEDHNNNRDILHRQQQQTTTPSAHLTLPPISQNNNSGSHHNLSELTSSTITSGVNSTSTTVELGNGKEQQQQQQGAGGGGVSRSNSKDKATPTVVVNLKDDEGSNNNNNYNLDLSKLHENSNVHDPRFIQQLNSPQPAATNDSNVSVMISGAATSSFDNNKLQEESNDEQDNNRWTAIRKHVARGASSHALNDGSVPGEDPETIKNLSPRTSEAMSEERFQDNLKRAAYYILDSFSGRLEHGLTTMLSKPRFVKLSFQAYNCFAGTMLYYSLAIILCLFAVGEDAKGIASNTVLGFELATLLLLIVTQLWKVGFMTLKGFMSKKINVFLVAILVANLIEVILTLANAIPIRPCRILRPIIFIARHRPTRGICATVLGMAGRLAPLSVTIFFFIWLFALIGVQLFHGLYDEFRYGDSLGGHFDDTPSAMLSLFVLLTTENVPDILLPAYRQSGWAMVYFVAYIVGGTYMLVSLTTAIVVDAYDDHNRDRVVKERVKERKALIRAFNLVDYENKGFITMDHWKSLMKFVRPQMEEEEVMVLFRAMDTDNSGKIDILEFFELCDVLRLRITKEVPAATFDITSRIDRLRLFICRLHRTPWRNRFVAALILLNFVCNSFVTHESLICEEDGTSINTTTKTGCSRLSWVDNVETVVVALFAAEVILSIFSFGVRQYLAESWHKYDAVIVFAAVATRAAVTASESSNSNHDVISFLSQINGIMTCLRVLRLVLLSPTFRGLGQSLVKVVPLFTYFSTLITFIMYAFALLGMIVFHDYPAVELDYYEQESFASLGSSYMMLLQMLLLSNWHTIMYAQIKVSGGASAVFFILYTVLVVYIVMNLLIALSWTSFKAHQNLLEDQEQEIAEQEKKKHEGNLIQDVVYKISRSEFNFTRALVQDKMQDVHRRELQELSQDKSLKIDELSQKSASTMFLRSQSKMVSMAARFAISKTDDQLVSEDQMVGSPKPPPDDSENGSGSHPPSPNPNSLSSAFDNVNSSASFARSANGTRPPLFANPPSTASAAVSVRGFGLVSSPIAEIEEVDDSSNNNNGDHNNNHLHHLHHHEADGESNNGGDDTRRGIPDADVSIIVSKAEKS